MTFAYPPVWECIYCGAKEPPLSREHVVPFGLGGDRILPRASCETCREKTRKVEEFCLRKNLGNTRIALGVQTQHPHERPANVTFRVTDEDGSVRSVLWPAESLPIFLIMPVYPVAQLMRPLMARPVNPPNGTAWIFNSSFGDLAKVGGKGGAVLIGAIDYLAFARMLAKMAHGFIVCELGLNKFRPHVKELIRQETDEYWHWVGGSADWTEPDPTDDIFQIHQYNHSGGSIIVRIRIFPCLGAPPYHVVVGEKL